MALPTIPIWTIRPNWREGINERLAWLTDVLESDNGTEQRRALRLSPRRSFEMTFNPFDQTRSYFDLFLHRLVAQEFMLPIFHDKALTTVDRIIGQTALAFDNTYREFLTGGYALLLGADFFTFEVVEITAQTAGGLTVSPLVQAWPAGTALYPLRKARLEDESMVSAITNHVGQATLAFTITEPNDYTEATWAGYVTHETIPVITREPNRREQLDLSFMRKSEVLDSETGLVHLADLAGRAFTVQIHNWMIRGRQEHSEFRSMLYRLCGRQKAVWLPTFNQDIVLARPSVSASANLDIKKIGYAYTGGIVSGRRHVIFRGQTPMRTAKINATGAPLAPDEERLVLSANFGAVFPAGRSASFLEIARLEADQIEIVHMTDSDGVSECNTPFRSFLNERLEDDENAVPIPAGNTTSGPCGYGAIFNLDFELGTSEGWQGTLSVVTTQSSAATAYQGTYMAWAGNNAFSSMYQDLNIPTGFLSAVDAGTAQAANFSAWHNTLDDQVDAGRLFMQFRDAGGIALGTVYSAYLHPNNWTLISIPTTAIPVGTRVIRFGAQSDRIEGTENNNVWDDFTPPEII